MIGYYNYTVVLTYLGLASGMCGIFVAMKEHPAWALFFLMLAGFFDMFDGLVAKTKIRSKNEKKFGIQLDSLSDLVCFGVLPAIIGYAIGLDEWYYLLVLIVYVLTALIRLAYFNVMEEERQEKTSEARENYEGLPVTSVALILPLLYAIIHMKPFANIIYGTTLLIIGFLFLSRIKIIKLKTKGLLVLIGLGALELLLLIIKRIL